MISGERRVILTHRIYVIARSAATKQSQSDAWQCILSQGERLEMAVRHDPREQQPAPPAQKPEEEPAAEEAK
jgi:hypothetical protein